MVVIISIISSGIISFISCVITKKKIAPRTLLERTVSFLTVTAFTVAALGHKIEGENFKYIDFYGEIQIKILILGILIAIIYGVLFSLIEIQIGKRSIKSLFSFREHRVLPKYSIKYACIILGVLFLCISIMDQAMVPYGLWKDEDFRIQSRMNYPKLWMVSDKGSFSYPLWRIEDGDISAKKQNQKTILVIGDSFIWGDGYSNANYLWWMQLEEEMKSRGYKDVQVIAAGQCGASTEDELRWLKDTTMLQDIQPDIIILGYVTNDAQYLNEAGEMEPSQLEPVSFFSSGIPAIMKSLFPNVTYIINNRLNIKLGQHTNYTDETGYPYEQWELEIVKGDNLNRYYNTAIKPLGEFVQKTKLPVFVVTNPVITDRDYYLSRYEHVLPLFEESGIQVYNMLEDYLEEVGNDIDSKNVFINPVNSHPGTAATKFYAKYVADILEDEYSQILGERQIELQTENAPMINDWMPAEVRAVEYKENQWTFTYPPQEDMEHFLYLPVQKPYIKLNFKTPTTFTELSIEGEKLKKADIWVTRENDALGYDDQELYQVGHIHGDDKSLKGMYENVTSICIHADIQNGEESKLLLKIQ